MSCATNLQNQTHQHYLTFKLCDKLQDGVSSYQVRLLDRMTFWLSTSMAGWWRRKTTRQSIPFPNIPRLARGFSFRVPTVILWFIVVVHLLIVVEKRLDHSDLMFSDWVFVLNYSALAGGRRSAPRLAADTEGELWSAWAWCPVKKQIRMDPRPPSK